MDYLALNKKLWDNKVASHVASDFYDMPAFLDGKNVLKPIELDLLGDINSESILHLQCHFGQDSLCLARMGAQVVGIDLSPKAIQKAQELNEELGLNAQFTCCDVYETRQYVSQKFDTVFTSFGTIGWLPDLDKWAKVIADSLKPGGRLIFVEFHPVVWMYDYDFKEIEYGYFKGDAIVENNEGTYADRGAALKDTEVSWNHHLGEVFSALIGAGLNITRFEEHSYSPHNCFNNMVETSPGQFEIKGLEGKIPLMYSLVAKN